jgi:hypothetical protein
MVTTSSSLAKLLDFPELRGDVNFSFGSAEDNIATSITKTQALHSSKQNQPKRSSLNNSAITPQTPPPACPPPPPPPINMPLPLDTSNTGWEQLNPIETAEL